MGRCAMNLDPSLGHRGSVPRVPHDIVPPHVSPDPTADVTFFTVKERGDGKAKSLVAFEGRWNPGCRRFARSEAARPSPAPQAESGKGAASQVSKIISSDDLHFRNQTRCRLSACRVELGCQALVFCHLDLKQPI